MNSIEEELLLNTTGNYIRLEFIRDLLSIILIRLLHSHFLQEIARNLLAIPAWHNSIALRNLCIRVLLFFKLSVVCYVQEVAMNRLSVVAYWQDIFPIPMPICAYDPRKYSLNIRKDANLYRKNIAKVQLHNNVHFWTNTLGKGMNPLIFTVMG